MGTPTTILLVDSSRFFLTMERQFLRNTTADVVEAQTLEQALSVCRMQPPHLVYADCELQGGETRGIDLCRHFKSDPRLSQIPVILLYDEAHPELREECRRAGCDGVLTKPLNRRRFLELGRSLLAGIRERRIPCQVAVRLHRGDRVCTGTGLDISSGGLFLAGPEALSPGDPLKLEVQLTTPSGQGPWILCNGTVAWVNEPHNPLRPEHPLGYGVRFTVLSSQAEAVLNGFLKAIGS